MNVVLNVLVLIILHANNCCMTWFQKYPRLVNIGHYRYLHKGEHTYIEHYMRVHFGPTTAVHSSI